MCYTVPPQVTASGKPLTEVVRSDISDSAWRAFLSLQAYMRKMMFFHPYLRHQLRCAGRAWSLGAWQGVVCLPVVSACRCHLQTDVPSPLPAPPAAVCGVVRHCNQLLLDCVYCVRVQDSNPSSRLGAAWGCCHASTHRLGFKFITNNCLMGT